MIWISPCGKGSGRVNGSGLRKTRSRVSVGVISGSGLGGIGVSDGIGVSVGALGSSVGVGGGVTNPSSTKAWAVCSITVGRISSGIKVAGLLSGKTPHPAVRITNETVEVRNLINPE